MSYYIIYDGKCNLCSNLVQALEQIDRGDRFQYLPMQDQAGLAQFGITAPDCELGVILIDAAHLDRRWQGTAAAEEIARLLPIASPLVAAYRSIPGLKAVGDRVYERFATTAMRCLASVRQLINQPIQFAQMPVARFLLLIKLLAWEEFCSKSRHLLAATSSPTFRPILSVQKQQITESVNLCKLCIQ